MSRAPLRETSVSAPYETVVGLEVHVELKTESKIFCSCPTAFGREPNSQVCPVCFGLPGSLPVLNERALEQAVRAALALNCRIREITRFDRKNYHYPDLPKGYQISQYELPIGQEGSLEVPDAGGGFRRVRIRRVHLEEDTGKSLHDQVPGASILDFNRSGVPLLEIVTEPDLRSGEQAREFLQLLRLILEQTGVSDVRMEEGSLRVDCNVSIRPHEDESGRALASAGITEIKNLNSFRSVARAIAYEAERQWEVLREGGETVRETRHWDERRGITFPSRSKEEAHDYRYFPDPDLLEVQVPADWVDRIRATLPELPDRRRRRWMETLGLGEEEAGILAADVAFAAYFEDLLREYPHAKNAANWLIGPVRAQLNTRGETLDAWKVRPAQLAALLKRIDEGTISVSAAKDVLEAMAESGEDAEQVIERRGLRQISDEEDLARIVDQVLASHPQPVQDYRNGKGKALGFLVGQVMKETRGRANPQVVDRILRQRLNGDGSN